MITIKGILFLLATLTSVACTVLLVREYLRTRIRLLLWSALCFVGLSLNNAVLFVDMIVFPQSDLRLMRIATALGSHLAMTGCEDTATVTLKPLLTDRSRERDIGIGGWRPICFTSAST